MKIISKLLIASAVAVSFAAPAFAIDYNSDSFVLQERGALTAPQAQSQSRDWTNAYAMDNSKSAGVDQSPYANRGIDYNSDSFVLQERGAWTAPQAQSQSRDWTNAYAMDNSESAWVDQSSYANRGAAQVNGGK